MVADAHFFSMWERDPASVMVWILRGDLLFRAGYLDAQPHPDWHFKASAPERAALEIAQFLQRKFPDLSPVRTGEMKLPPGGYYPRMVRPTVDNPHDSPGERGIGDDRPQAIAIGVGQLASLVATAERIFAVVHPEGDNLRAYGHEVRNLLILACTEVEAHWRAILEANGYTKRNYSTKDYVLLKTAMKLHEYAIAFPTLPWLKPSSPFGDWGATANPTQDLPWYAAYNAVKHDREGSFSDAQLAHAINAVAACTIMVVAQFGVAALRNRGGLVEFLNVVAAPKWPPEELYAYWPGTDTPQPINYSF